MVDMVSCFFLDLYSDFGLPIRGGSSVYNTYVYIYRYISMTINVSCFDYETNHMPVVCKRKAWLLKHLCYKYSTGRISSTKYDWSKWLRSPIDIKFVFAKYSWVCAFEFDLIWTIITFMSLLSSHGIIASIPATLSGPMPTSYRSASSGEETVQNGTTIVTWLRGRPQWKHKVW